MCRGLRPLPWFFAGLLGNVAALFVLLTAAKRGTVAAPAGVPPGLAKVPVTHAPVSCAQCGHSNHPAAQACSHCHAALSPTVQSEVTRAQKGDAS